MWLLLPLLIYGLMLVLYSMLRAEDQHTGFARAIKTVPLDLEDQMPDSSCEFR